MKIALIVNYVLNMDDKTDFYDAEDRHILDGIDKELNNRFPQKITLSENVRGTRNDITYIPLNKNKNYVRCDCCGRYLSISKGVYLGLEYPTRIKGKNLCLSCKWELEDEL